MVVNDKKKKERKKKTGKKILGSQMNIDWDEKDCLPPPHLCINIVT